MAVMSLQNESLQHHWCSVCLHQCSYTRTLMIWTGGSSEPSPGAGTGLGVEHSDLPAGCPWASVNGGCSREPSQPPHPPRAAHINAALISEGADQPIMHSSVKMQRLKGILLLYHSVQNDTQYKGAVGVAHCPPKPPSTQADDNSLHTDSDSHLLRFALYKRHERTLQDYHVRSICKFNFSQKCIFPLPLQLLLDEHIVLT